LQTIATLRGTGGGASLMLNGHTDINALTRRWRRDPWTPTLEGDRLYGHAPTRRWWRSRSAPTIS
jgi:acetylornithine deacetylase